MARFPAKVVFPDGTAFLAIFNGAVDVVQPHLCRTEEERSAAWGRKDDPDLSEHPDDEIAIVHTSDDDPSCIRWRVRASRRRMLIIGPLSCPNGIPPDNEMPADGILHHESEAHYGDFDAIAARTASTIRAD